MWNLGGWKFFLASCTLAALVAAGMARQELEAARRRDRTVDRLLVEREALGHEMAGAARHQLEALRREVGRVDRRLGERGYHGEAAPRW